MQLSFVLVESPGHGKRWIKAVADLTDSLLVVSDRRGKEVLRIEASQEVVEGTRQRTWRYGEVTVQDMPGACACGGGMRVETL